MWTCGRTRLQFVTQFKLSSHKISRMELPPTITHPFYEQVNWLLVLGTEHRVHGKRLREHQLILLQLWIALLVRTERECASMPSSTPSFSVPTSSPCSQQNEITSAPSGDKNRMSSTSLAQPLVTL